MLSVMITIEVDFDNPISQDFYNKIIFSLNLNQIHCTCGLAGSLIWYGGYYRKVRMADRVIFLRVARVLCTACGHKTPSFFLHLSRIPRFLSPFRSLSPTVLKKGLDTTVSFTLSPASTKIPFLLLSVLTGSTGSSVFALLLFLLPYHMTLSANALHPFPDLSCR